MGEIFTYERPPEPLPFSGERMTSAMAGQIEYEHLHRYLFARALVRDLDVADVACGEGYGAALLSQTARSVVGVEIDAETVRHATSAYARPGLSYIEGDARRIPLPDACVDVVVSFETIEHFFEHDAFLAEIRRILRPGGRLIISSPDRDVYSPLNGRVNPFHVHELSRAEFGSLLDRHFAHVALYAQRPLLGSALVADGGTRPHRAMTFEKRGEHLEASAGLPRAYYVVAIASDTPVGEDVSSVYIDSSNVDLPHTLSLQLDQSRSEYDAARARAEVMQRERDDMHRARDDTQRELGGVQREMEAMQQAIAAARHDTAQVEAALSAEKQARDAALAALRSEAQAAEAEAKLAGGQAELRIEALQHDLDNAHAAMAAIEAQARQHEAAQAAANAATLAATRAELHEHHDAHRRLLAHVGVMEGSRSWRITAPLRRVVRALRGRSLLGKAARLVFWTLTLQLPRRAQQFSQLRQDTRAIAASGLFDTHWYMRQVPGLGDATADPLSHYVRHGRFAGLDPHPLFSASHYRAQLAHHGLPPLPLDTEPLSHFLREGAARNADPHPWFSVAHYRAQFQNLGENPLVHYLSIGGSAGASPHPDFDGTWYGRHYPDIGAENPLVHFVTTGAARGYEPNPASIQARTRLRRETLGLDLPPPTLRIATGIVTYNSDPAQLSRCLASAQVALEGVGEGSGVLLIDNGAPTDAGLLARFMPHVVPTQGNLGFGAAHNLLMQAAFTAGADLYVAVNPDGFFHPDCLRHLARMSVAAHGRALIEALQFPDEHPKAYDMADYETPWASGACLAIPRQLYAAIGGFDDQFFMYCEDVDLSWRARAAGFEVKTCPMALFYHSVADRDPAAIDPYLLKSGLILGHKWAAPPAFFANIEDRLQHAGLPMPDLPPVEPMTRGLQVPDFSRMFHFAPVRW